MKNVRKRLPTPIGLAWSAMEQRLGFVGKRELAMRWSVFRAGHESAANPAYVVRPQRERLARDGARRPE